MGHLIDRVGRKLARLNRDCRRKNAAVKLFAEGTNPRERAELLRHVVSCPECRSEFEAVRKVWMRSEEFLKPLEQAGPLSADAGERLRSLARSEIRSLTSSRRARQRPALRMRSIWAGAAAILLIVLTSVFILQRFPRHGFQERTSSDRGFLVFQPWDLTRQRPVVFRWKAQAMAEHYELEILDAGLETVFVEGGIPSSSYSLPDEVYLRLKRGRMYFWRVTASLKGGRSRESEFGKFSVPE